MTSTAEVIATAYANDANLKKRIFDAINVTPQHAPLFEDIAKYQLASQQFSIANSKSHDLEQPLKKRKLEDGTAAANGTETNQPRSIILEARDISFAMPQRKKLHLALVQYGSDFDAATTTFAICGRSPATSQVEFEYPVAAFAHAMRVSVPEKAQKQYNFCLLPAQAQSTGGSAAANEGMIWTVNHGPLKSCQIHSEELKKAAGSDDILETALSTVLQRSGRQLVYPRDDEFVSSLVESHRKNDKAYHVKAFRGSKDGYLFFLENGIFFGFKKPLAFFAFSDIDSVSYTAVLQRTFNLVIIVQGPNTTEQQEIEFSMLDQADFAGIDAYIRKHQLQDSSMAEARRAKQFNVNGIKKTEAVGEQSGEQTELQKAEQELEDEEDEMEEDYNPSDDDDDDSEGSGSSDDEDEYEYTKGRGKDLIKDELGSEAEEVEITDDEGEEEEEEVEDDEAHDEIQEKRQSKPASKETVTKSAVSSIHPAPPADNGVPDFDDDDQL